MLCAFLPFAIYISLRLLPHCVAKAYAPSHTTSASPFDCFVPESRCVASPRLGTLKSQQWMKLIQVIQGSDLFVPNGSMLKLFSSVPDISRFVLTVQIPFFFSGGELTAANGQMEPNLAFLVRAPSVAVPESKVQFQSLALIVERIRKFQPFARDIWKVIEYQDKRILDISCRC